VRVALQEAWEEAQSWSEVAAQITEEFKESVSAEACRSAYRRHLRKMVDNAVETEKEALIARVERRELRRLLTERSKTEIVCEALKTAILQLPPLDPIPKPNYSDKPFADEHAVLMISDTHIGQKLERSKVAGLWSYNTDIFRSRLRILAAKLEQIVPRHNYRIPVLHIDFLGDIVEGLLTFKGQMRQVDQTLLSSAMVALEEFTWFIRFCLQLFDVVECEGVPGNHPRVGEKGELDPIDNFDMVAYHFLRLRFENEPRVKWHISEGAWQISKVFDWNRCLLHGDVIPSWMSIPFYGIARHNNNTRTMVDDLAGLHIDTIELGHFHQPGWLPFGTWGICFLNGSFCGATDLSINKMRVASAPCQWFYGVSPERPVTWQYPLVLSDRHETGRSP